jgi:5-methylcytosine-specific restriction endonuclease McrA
VLEPQPGLQPRVAANLEASDHQGRRLRAIGSTNRLSAHHVIPRAEGGPDEPDDLVSLCVSCHARMKSLRRSSR